MIHTKFDDYIIEELLAESTVNEKIDFSKVKSFVNNVTNKKEAVKKLISKFNQTKNISTRKLIGATIIMLLIGNFVMKNNKWATSNDFQKEVEAATLSLIDKVEKNGEISVDDVDVPKVKKLEYKYPIISMGTPGLIDDVNKVKPYRLDTSKIAQYDQYDKDIIDALMELKAKGETPDINLIKIIMVIETGMKPVKNELGYEGFPQTKEHILNGWTDKKGIFHPGVNQKHGTNFTMKDMYDPGKSAQFIYYYLKSLFRSDNVETIPDILIAYNWGVGNLGKYKRGDKKLPKQSEDYVDMYQAMQPYVAQVLASHPST